MNTGVDRATERFAPIQKAGASGRVRSRQPSDLAQQSRDVRRLVNGHRPGYGLLAQGFGRWLVAGVFPASAVLVADKRKEQG